MLSLHPFQNSVKSASDPCTAPLQRTRSAPLAGVSFDAPTPASTCAGTTVPACAPAAPRPPAPGTEKAQQLLKARFGDAALQAQVEKAKGLADLINAQIVGQDALARILQDRVVQLLEGQHQPRKAPLALHLIGLPGVGKSASLELLEHTGVHVVKINVNLAAGASPGFAQDLVYSLRTQVQDHSPCIVIFDELDKAAENNNQGVEDGTNPFIGILNQLLNEGMVTCPGYRTLKLQQCLIVTAMNFSPRQMETFAPEVLGTPKSFYDFTSADMAAFDAWVRDKPAARSKVLSYLFRSNTVSRLSPDSLLVRPLNTDDYRVIITREVEAALAPLNKDGAQERGLSATYDISYIDFLAQRIVYPPSGARETVSRARLMTQQLMHFAAKAQGSNPLSLVQERKARIEAPAGGDRLVVHVSSSDGSAETTGDDFSFTVEYDAAAQTLLVPASLAWAPPIERAVEAVHTKTAQEKLLEARFPKAKKVVTRLATRIGEKLFGLERYARIVERDLNAVLGRPGPTPKTPPFRVIAGFPGIGKSALAELAAEHSGLPLARINLQAYAGTDTASADKFLEDISDAIADARRKSDHGGKFILLFEELDKIFELNPKSGDCVSRPVMNYIKDLLNDGRLECNTGRSGGGRSVNVCIDIRHAYGLITMNFGVDRFGFSGDPRLTTLRDVHEAWKSLQHPAKLKDMLKSMFLPETVSRLMPRFMVMQPASDEVHHKVINEQVAKVITQRFVDPTTQENAGQIDLRLTDRYRHYLYEESVIPSEGVRHTELVTEQRLSVDLEEVMENLPEDSELATEPLILTLDFDPEATEVSATASACANPGKSERIYTRKIELSFPPLKATGPISAERVVVSMHEFGHMMAGVRLGKRFEAVTVVSTSSGVGGYVKFTGEGEHARDLITRIYVALGSRAMERIILSDSPRAPESVLDITCGASADIVQATEGLWSVMNEYGMDPAGGPIDRRGTSGGARYASFPDIPHDAVDRLQGVLRGMESYMVDDLCRAHPRAWYVDRIERLARAGAMSEAQAYALIDYPYPGEKRTRLAPNPRLRHTFGDLIKADPADIAATRSFKQGDTQSTLAENVEQAVRHFAKLIQPDGEHVAA